MRISLTKIQGDAAPAKKTNFCSIWCERGDLNPHALRHRILSPARLPFRHSRSSKNLKLLKISATLY